MNFSWLECDRTYRSFKADASLRIEPREQGLEHFPNVFRHDSMAGGCGMNVVGLI
jgi:hypothetical protein